LFFVSLCQWPVGGWLFLKPVFKIIPGLCSAYFFVAFFGGHNYIICKQQFLQQQAVTVFFAASF
jgi:hypothetical protein